jgi:hypothetical protein
MPTIPILGIRLFDPEHTTHFLKQRFMTHLEMLRTGSKSASTDAAEDRPIRDFKLGDPSAQDINKIDRRALQPLAKGAELITIPSEHRADEIAAELHADMQG